MIKMKARVIVEFEEEFIDYVMREGNITSAEELKGYIRGIYAQTVEQEKGIKNVTVEVSDEETAVDVWS